MKGVFPDLDILDISGTKTVSKLRVRKQFILEHLIVHLQWQLHNITNLPRTTIRVVVKII